MHNIKKKDFTLNKVKFLKEGMEIEYQIPRSEQIGTLANCSMKTSDQPHDDLLNILDKFKHPLLVASNALIGTNVLLNKKGNLVLDPKIPQKTITKYRDKVVKSICESIDVKGVSFHGNDENEVIKINGGFNSSLGYSGLNTPNILIGDSLTEHGLDCDELAQAIDDLRDEVFEYVVKCKHGIQEEIPFDENKEEDPHETVAA